MRKKKDSRFLNMIRNFRIAYMDKDRKDLRCIIKEFLIASFKSKSIATYYFTSVLYKKNISNYLDYISHKEWQYMQRAICDSNTHFILGDKLYTQYYFEKFNIPMPPLLAYNIREKMVIEDNNTWNSHEISSVETLRNLIKILFRKSSNNSIFIKPIVGSGGHEIIRLDCRIDEVAPEQIGSLFKNFLLGAYVFQDEIKSHPDLAKFNPKTLNSIRIDTFKADGQPPEVISAFFRIGGVNACVDNASSGGCFVGINIESGILKNRGTYKLAYGGFFNTHHPETGIKFEGYKMPFFEDVKSLAIDVANCFPQSLVGWDIAISDCGPVLIEGNTLFYAMSTSDIAYGGYRKNPVYRKITDYVKNQLTNH